MFWKDLRNRGGSRIFFKGGPIFNLGRQQKRGAGGGPTLGSMLKILQRGPKRGVDPPGSAHVI